MANEIKITESGGEVKATPAHTPGPWYVAWHDGEKASTEILAGSASAPNAIAHVFGTDLGEEERANASLIASAPALLEAVLSVSQQMENFSKKVLSGTASDEEIGGMAPLIVDTWQTKLQAALFQATGTGA